MEFHTKMTDLLHVRYPIMLGGIKGLGRAPLAAAVSNAGGFGVITAGCFSNCADPVEALRDEIRHTRELTDKPFGVNISMNPGAGSDYGPLTNGFVEVVCQEGIPAVETSGRSPDGIVGRLHDNGVKVIHKVASARFARKAEQAGVDAVACIGYESGGHSGLDQVSGHIVLQRTLSMVHVPVLCAASVVNGPGLLSALALGAEGVTIGTRFICSQESPAHPKMKEWIVAHNETDTMLVQRSIRNPIRAIKNDMAYRVLGYETMAGQPKISEIMPLINGQRSDEAMAAGDIENCLFSCGQGMGLIQDIPTIAEIVEEMIRTAGESYLRLQSMLSGT